MQCEICQQEQALYAFQPFKVWQTKDAAYQIVPLGQEIPDIPVIHIGENCRQRILAGEQVVFEHGGYRYVIFEGDSHVVPRGEEPAEMIAGWVTRREQAASLPGLLETVSTQNRWMWEGFDEFVYSLREDVQRMQPETPHRAEIAKAFERLDAAYEETIAAFDNMLHTLEDANKSEVEK